MLAVEIYEMLCWWEIFIIVVALITSFTVNPLAVEIHVHNMMHPLSAHLSIEQIL